MRKAVLLSEQGEDGIITPKVTLITETLEVPYSPRTHISGV